MISKQPIDLAHDEYRRMDFEYACPACNQPWAACTCPVPDPAIVAQRIAAARARLLGR